MWSWSSFLEGFCAIVRKMIPLHPHSQPQAPSVEEDEAKEKTEGPRLCTPFFGLSLVLALVCLGVFGYFFGMYRQAWAKGLVKKSEAGVEAASAFVAVGMKSGHAGVRGAVSPRRSSRAPMHYLTAPDIQTPRPTHYFTADFEELQEDDGGGSNDAHNEPSTMLEAAQVSDVHQSTIVPGVSDQRVRDDYHVEGRTGVSDQRVRRDYHVEGRITNKRGR